MSRVDNKTVKQLMSIGLPRAGAERVLNDVVELSVRSAFRFDEDLMTLIFWNIDRIVEGSYGENVVYDEMGLVQDPSGEYDDVAEAALKILSKIAEKEFLRESMTIR